jgi:peptide/nickel transport system permease protein
MEGIRFHVLPNVTAPILVLASTVLALAILSKVPLSFLGLGVLPPVPIWGNMMALGTRQYFAFPSRMAWP